MSNQMAQKQNFMFSTDSYNDDSIKDQERAQKETGDHLVLDGLAIKISNDFKLPNDKNKEQLCHMLKKV